MDWFRRERTSLRNWDPPTAGLDRYDPCEIDPPGYMFVRIGAAVAFAQTE